MPLIPAIAPILQHLADDLSSFTTFPAFFFLSALWFAQVRSGGKTLSAALKEQFLPLCDLHHTSMQRMMLEEDSVDVRSCHHCDRPGCTRVFRESNGYSDFIDGEFDDSRASIRTCPQCGGILYLAEVDRSQKLETWECPVAGCEFSHDDSSPAAR